MLKAKGISLAFWYKIVSTDYVLNTNYYSNPFLEIGFLLKGNDSSGGSRLAWRKTKISWPYTLVICFIKERAVA